jgi:hypothetical protein
VKNDMALEHLANFTEGVSFIFTLIGTVLELFTREPLIYFVVMGLVAGAFYIVKGVVVRRG